MRLRYFLPVFMLLGMAWAQAGFPYSPPDKSFMATFPAEPNRSPAPATAEKGNIGYLHDKEGYWTVQWIRDFFAAARSPEQVKAKLEGVADHYVQGVSAATKKVRLGEHTLTAGTHQGKPCLDITGTLSDGGHLYTRLIAASPRLYIVSAAVYAKPAAAKAAGESFLASFKMR